MSNKQISVIAKNYGKAIFELGCSNVVGMDKILADIDLIQQSLTDELVNLLISPVVAVEKKQEIFSEIFKNKVDKHILDFMLLIIEKDRFSDFEGMIESFKSFVDDKNGVQSVEVTSAVELNEDYKSAIIAKLNEKLHKEVRVSWLVNEDIIAGLMIKINDNLIDLSVSTKLKSLSKNIR